MSGASAQSSEKTRKQLRRRETGQANSRSKVLWLLARITLTPKTHLDDRLLWESRTVPPPRISVHPTPLRNHFRGLEVEMGGGAG